MMWEKDKQEQKESFAQFFEAEKQNEGPPLVQTKTIWRPPTEAKREESVASQKRATPATVQENQLLRCQMVLCLLWILAAVVLKSILGSDALQGFYTQYAEGGLHLAAQEQISRFANAGVEWVQEKASELLEKAEAMGRGQQGKTETGEGAQPEGTGTSAQTLSGQGGAENPVMLASGQYTLPEGNSLARYVLSDVPLLPVAGRVTSSFGFRDHPLSGDADFHTGVDLAAPENTPVRAAFQGEVLSTGNSATGGIYVKLRHGEEVETAYYHMKTVYVVPGQAVSRGQPVGCVGLTGVTTGYHLHFELRINGLRVDPQKALEYVL